MSKTRREFEQEVGGYIIEARSLLPGLPPKLSFVWDERLVIPGNGTGGSLLEPTVLGIGYDPDFDDTKTQSKHLRATVLHECFHAVQGWSVKVPTLIPDTLLEDGVLEGAATVFERDVGGTLPFWADYEDDETMQQWLIKIQSQKLDPNSDQYTAYKFGNVDGVAWMLYKVGTWITDKALARNSQITIVDLATKTPKQIIELAGIKS